MTGSTVTPARENGGNGTAATQARSPIANVFEVLRCFTAEEPLQGVTEVAAQVGLHKSSVSRLLTTLEELEVVEREESSRKYRLGLGLIGIAGPLLANLDVRRLALPSLRQLAGDTRETAALAVWNGSETVIVEQVASPLQIKHTTALGTRYCTTDSASVRVFLAERDSAEVRALVERGHLETSGSVANVLERLEHERERGFAVNHGDTSPDEVGIASPVRDHRGEVVAAVLLAAPFYRAGERVAELAGACRATAAEISARLGGPGR